MRKLLRRNLWARICIIVPTFLCVIFILNVQEEKPPSPYDIIKREISKAENLETVDKFMKRFAVVGRDKSIQGNVGKGQKILCFVMTTPANIQTKAVAVNNTWGGRCTKLLFVNTESIPNLNVMAIDVEEGRDHLTKKTVKSLQHLYQHYLNDYDWFFKSDDDVYVIMENLGYLLSNYDSREAVYLGHQFRIGTRQGYMSGGAGFLISRGALQAINEKGFDGNSSCRTDGNDEDLDIGDCFDKIGVKTFSTVDKFGRQSFHPFGISKTIMSEYYGGQMFYVARPIKNGADCCSQLSISFHYVNPVQMYLLDFILYKSDVHGRYPQEPKERLFTSSVAVIPHKKDNEILLVPRYFWHFLFGRRKVFNSGHRHIQYKSQLFLVILLFYAFVS